MSALLRAMSALGGSLLLASALLSTPAAAQSGGVAIEPGESSRATLAEGSWLRYRLDNPAGLDSTTARLIDLTGDIDLYVQYGRLPTLGDYACRSWQGGTAEESCSIDFRAGTTVYIGVYGYRAGAYTLAIDAGSGGGGTGTSIGERSGRIVWEGWNLDYDTFTLNDGLTLHDVAYEGTRLLERASFPVMSVYYDNDVCGPYADRLNGPQAEVSWAGNAKLVAREFTRDGKRWFELGIREFIGSYDIYQVWYLGADGELDGHVFSRGLQCNVDHVHYPMWRFDFDIDGAGNDRILRETSAGQLSAFASEFETAATDAFRHGWYVEDTASGYRVKVDFDGGGGDVGGTVVPASDYANNRVGGVTYRSSEQGWTSGPSRNFPYDNGESLGGGDVVMWYRGYLPHTPEEGSALWHSTGVRITPDAAEAVACGSPGVDPASEGGVHVWKECDGGPWTLLLTGPSGADSIRASGQLGSALGFAGVTPRSVESSDTLDGAGSRRVRFDLVTGNPWEDRFEFTTLEGDELCLGFEQISASEQLYLGRYRVPAGLGPVNPETLESCEFSGPDCTAPQYDSSSERALFSWVDCAGVLHLVGSGAQQSTRYAGHVYASVPFSGIETRSFESGDTLAAVSATDVFFDMSMGGGAVDEILLSAPSGAELCVEITRQSSGTRLLGGAERTEVSSPFDPRTLQPCEPPAGDTVCGDPQVDSTTDSALFVWKSCDGVWTVLLTGVRPDGNAVNVIGSIDSSAGFESITPKGIESTDSVSSASGSPLSFDMRTISPWTDAFEFEVEEGASLCVSLGEVSAGLEVLAGPDRTPVGSSFDPVTLAACP